MARWTIERVGAVALVRIDDGKVNAFTVPELEDLERALDDVLASDARSLVITGRPDAFSAGLNTKAMATMSVDEKKALMHALGRSMLKVFVFPRPVVAAVTGHALGAGAMLALAADVRILADGSYKFGLNEVPIGLFVPTFGIEIAAAAISASRLTDLLLHGRTLSPMEALGMHIAEAVHSPDALRAAALMRARDLGTLGAGYAVTKRLLREARAEHARQRLPDEVDQLAKMLR